MSVASSTASDDDSLMKAINNLLEPELRAVLQHISLLHPEVVHAALKHQQFVGGFDDMHSVITVTASNTSKSHSDESPPPVRGNIHGTAHPSKCRSMDTDDDTNEPHPPKGGSFFQQGAGLNGGNYQAPFVPLRRIASPPPLHEESSSRAPAPPRKRVSPPPPPCEVRQLESSHPRKWVETAGMYNVMLKLIITPSYLELYFPLEVFENLWHQYICRADSLMEVVLAVKANNEAISANDCCLCVWVKKATLLLATP